MNSHQKKLILAIQKGALEDVKKLVEGGCSPNFDTGYSSSSSPLFTAIVCGRDDIVRWLVDTGGVDYNYSDIAYVNDVLGDVDVANFLALKKTRENK